MTILFWIVLLIKEIECVAKSFPQGKGLTVRNKTEKRQNVNENTFGFALL